METINPPDKEMLMMADHAEMQNVAREDLDRVPTADLSITRASWWDNKKIISIAIFINLASLSYSIDTGTINGFQAMPGFLMVFGYPDPALPIGFGITTKVQQLITSLATLGMCVSCIMFGYISSYLGRKGTLWLACVFCVASLAVQISVSTAGGLYAGRFILGLGNALFLLGGQIYMQECMPANFRSLNFTFYQAWIGLGTLLGAILNNYTATILNRNSYRIPLAVNFVGPVLLFIGLFFLPESPRYLCLQNKHDQAYRALRHLRDASYSDLKVEEELAEIKYAIAMDLQSGEGVRFWHIFRCKNLRRTMTSVATASFNTANGSQFTLQYGVYFFILSGDTHAFRDVVILLTLGLFGTLLRPFFTGWVGKRPVLMFGSFMCGLCMLGMGVADSARGIDPTSGRVIVSMTVMYLFFYGSTVSPYSAQVTGEIPSQPLRGHTMALGWAMNFFLRPWPIREAISPCFGIPTPRPRPHPLNPVPSPSGISPTTIPSIRRHYLPV